LSFMAIVLGGAKVDARIAVWKAFRTG